MKSNSPLWLLSAFIAIFSLPINASSMSSSDSVRWLIQQSRFKEATDITQRLQRSGSISAEMSYCEGLAWKGLNRYTAAINAFTKSYRQDSLLTSNLTELGTCFRLLNNYNQSLFWYDKAWKKDSTSSVLWSEIAGTCMAGEKYERALSLYRQLAIHDPQNSFFLLNMGKCFDYIGKTDSAMVYYANSLNLVRDDYQTTYRLCSILLKKKEYRTVLAATEDYRRRDSTNQRINSLNAYAYMLTKDYQESYNRFLACYRNHDESKFTVKYLGITAFKLNNMVLAKEYLEKAYQLDSTDYETTNFLGIACATSAYKKLGIFYLNKTLELILPDSTYLGNVYGNLGKAYDAYSNAPCKQAFDSYLTAHSLMPFDATYTYLIASKYDFCLQNREKAIQYYRQFLDAYAEDIEKWGIDPTIVSYAAAATRRLKELTRK
jgi:tetratricopeptide (TPR) repeat protein